MKKFATVLLCFLVGLEVFGQGDFKLRFWGEVGTSGNIDQPVTAIAVGSRYSLALKADGTVVAWGANSQNETVIPNGLKNVKAISTSGVYNLALKTDGTVVSWPKFQIGQNTLADSLTDVMAISAGGNYFLALKTNGTVVAWGIIDNGHKNVPIGLSGVKAISAGGLHNLALKTDGTVVAWGDNKYGQTDVPIGLSGVKAISASYGHSLVLKNDGTVVAWGDNTNGQTTIPVGLIDVKAISAASDYSLALKTDGTVVAWGKHDYQNITILPEGLSEIKAIAAGAYRGLALKNDGTIVSWGHNNYGESTIPVGLSNIKTISSGWQYFIALKMDGTVAGWGRNDLGQVDIPINLEKVKAISSSSSYFNHALREDSTVIGWGTFPGGGRFQFGVLDNLVGIKAISVGGEHSLGLKTDGTVVGWPDSQNSQQIIPKGLTNVKAVSAGGDFCLALKSNGTIVAWGGINNYGEINIPVGLNGVKAISAGPTHSLALKTDGTVVAWGDTSFGMSHVPIGLSGVKAISAGDHNLALKSDGTVVAWGGDNYYGQTTVPIGLAGVQEISAGGNFSVALLSASATRQYSGKIFLDSLSNCKFDLNDQPLPRFTIRATSNTDTLYSGTDNYGSYYFDNLDSGKTYKLTSLASKAFRDYGILSTTLCDTTFTLLVGKNDSTHFDIGYKLKYCTALKLNVQATRRRRCLKNTTKVSYTNTGLLEAKNAVLNVAFPRYVKPIRSDFPWSTKQDSLLTFIIPSIKTSETKTITITDSVVCGNESIRGLTQCTKAWFTKANPCQDTSTLWDKSWVSLKGSGTPNNNFRFVAKNLGKGNMSDSTSYRVYYSSSLAYASKIKLKAGDSLEIILPTFGKAARLEIDQRPYTPGSSSPSLTLNTCNGVVLDDKGLRGFPQDDAAPEVAIDCLPITDSYDPNDKQVSPSGWGNRNFTKPNARLTYTVRFQNTGTDTAYNVVVVDTLDKNLDITTLEIEGASHPYQYRISGKNQVILTFSFEYINLPDSTRDKIKSNGFIQYTILAKKGIKKGAKISNRAAIYFDFNSPVLTNTTANEMRDTVYFDKTIIKGVVKTANGLELLSNITELEADVYSKESLKVFPNPAQSTLYIQSSFKDRRYLICDLSGKMVQEGNLESAGNGIVDVSGLHRGVYLLKVGVSWVRVVLM